MSIFPIFAADRLRTRLRENATRKVSQPESVVVSLPQVSSMVERTLMGMPRLDQRLPRRSDLPFGSSVVVAASKPDVHQLSAWSGVRYVAGQPCQIRLRDVS